MTRVDNVTGGDRTRVLIVDFDFFTSVGGGQVLYRRIVERHPAIDFYYLSTSPDCRLKNAGRIPTNAHPVLCDPRLDVNLDAHDPFAHMLHVTHVARLEGVAAAVQGMAFHCVDVPSFFPVANFIRPVMAAYGVTVERVALGMVGWPSVSARNLYQPIPIETLAEYERAETASMEAADVRYTISRSEMGQNKQTSLPVEMIDMRDAIESFPPLAPEPPGKGVPDLWYVGRLDGTKGPDLFIRMAAQIPRHLYGRVQLSGPDNNWSRGERWSENLLRLADSLGVKASYEGVLSDSEIRSRVYGGRTVMVVPSRTDAFNYVALEAILNACPLVLSNRTGAYGFLRDEHPRLLPAIMDPDDITSAADSLRKILSHYPTIARERRRELIERPFPAPKIGFMEPVYNCPRAGQAIRGQEVEKDAIARCAGIPLRNPAAHAWRESRKSESPRVTVVIPTFNRPELLAPTLACLTQQTFAGIEVVVLDDGSADELRVRSVAESFGPLVRLIRKGNTGEASTVNRGIDEARGEFVGFLSDDDVYDPELLESSIAALDRDPRAIGTYPDWDIIDVAGQFVEEHKVPDFNREKMLTEHWCFPGPGSVVRRDVLLKIGGRDTAFRFVSDFDLWLRATKYGPMIHLPRKLAYWRLHASNLTSSERRKQMARERLLLIEKFFRDPEEQWQPDVVRRTYASAHLVAAAILGRAEPQESLRWLRCAEKLAPGCSKNLPANMAGYPALWPGTEEAAVQ